MTLPKFIRYYHNLARKGYADKTGERLVMFRVMKDDLPLDPLELADATQVWLIYTPSAGDTDASEDM